MKEPDQRAFDTDLEDGPFRIGVAKGYWGLADSSKLPEGFVWPQVMVWIAAAPRQNAPERFYVSLNCEKYPSVPPTGMFWDPVTKSTLAVAKRPTGTGQVAAVFRRDNWENGRAFYHPYDRVAVQSHTDWPKNYPHLIWNPAKHTIVDFLSEMYALLHSPQYTGV